MREAIRQKLGGYVKTPVGHEVDFLATARDGGRQLVQVTADVLDRGTLERELLANFESRR